MIYFVQPVDGGPIKIGFTSDLPTRLATLAATNHHALKVLGTMEGLRPTEEEIHRRFAHLRLRNEWFNPADDLMEFIGGIKSFTDDAPIPSGRERTSFSDIDRYLHKSCEIMDRRGKARRLYREGKDRMAERLWDESLDMFEHWADELPADQARDLRAIHPDIVLDCGRRDEARKQHANKRARLTE